MYTVSKDFIIFVNCFRITITFDITCCQTTDSLLLLSCALGAQAQHVMTVDVSEAKIQPHDVRHLLRRHQLRCRRRSVRRTGEEPLVRVPAALRVAGYPLGTSRCRTPSPASTAIPTTCAFVNDGRSAACRAGQRRFPRHRREARRGIPFLRLCPHSGCAAA